MQYINLGSAGVKVSRICLGTMTYGSKTWRPWVLDEDESKPFFRRALDLGINFLDTADMYSVGASEEVVGHALKQLGVARDKVVIATKVFNPMGDDVNQRGLSRKHIRHAIDNSLRRLGVDYVDLYQIHRLDPTTPMVETLEALDAVVRSGKALYIGASSMYAWQFAEMLNISERLGLARFITMQNHYNLVYREEEREMLPLCRAKGIGVIPWSPLARGFLAGNRRRASEGFGDTTRAKTDEFGQKLYWQESDFAVADRVVEVARRRGVAPAQIALAWVLEQSGVTAPIIGASKLQHLDDAVKSLEIKLSDEELRSLEEPYRPHAVSGHQ